MWARTLLILTATVTLSACTSAETSLTTPTATDARCDVRASTSTTNFNATGGSATLAISTTRDCTWTVSSEANWLTISGARSGQGEASIGYSVAANTVPSARSTAIAVGGDRVEVTQAAAACRFSLSRGGDTIGYAGGRMAVDLTTLTGCSWSASVNQNWVSIASGQSGNSSATIGLTVAANNGGSRVAAVSVGGQTYTITQEGTPPPEPPAPAPPPTPGPGPTPTPGPGPTPTPPPTPTPAPTPPPPAPRPVHLDGRAFLVVGGCPNIAFLVDGTQVAADGSTDYKKGNCGDVTNGRGVKVDGVLSGVVVRATKIELQKDKDNDR